jgi:hypothetical protein
VAKVSSSGVVTIVTGSADLYLPLYALATAVQHKDAGARIWW